MSAPITLAPESVELIAQRTAELLRGEEVVGGLVDAAEVARRFGVTREWVYEHKARIGGVPLGDGERPRWRFDPATVAELLVARPHPITATTPKRTSRRRRRSTRQDLLPIREPNRSKGGSS